MKARVMVRLVGAGVAALTIGAGLGGCGGSLNGGAAGRGGSADYTGQGGADTGGTGSGATGGTTGVGGTGGACTTGAGGYMGFGQPNCPATVTRGSACAATDLQFCYRPCGPENSGVKSDTCQTDGTYAEMSGCSYDPCKDYSCYSIPAAANDACPSGMPQASAACSVQSCMVCNSLGGVAGGIYLDSAGAAKNGFCVCAKAKWSCASDISWPCPGSAGCSATGGGGSSAGGTGGTGGGAGGGPVGPGGGGGTGATGTGGTGGAFGQPACPSTVTKGGICAATDVPFCYKACGPEKTGVKSETCDSTGVYAEMAGCLFDQSKDYSCYAIPAVSNSACPAGVTPQASGVCDVPTCTVCNSTQGTSGGGYLDSAGAAHVGSCVCQAANSAGARVWSCASDTAWPCPAGSGC